MRESVWEILGIAATADERAIKRAYAAMLRTHSPEADPAGYMKLREAYEAAKRHAEGMRDSGGVEGDESWVRLSPEPPAPPPAPEIPEDNSPSPQRQAFIELQSLLSENKLDEFVRKIDDIRASGIFATLDEQQDFIGEIAVLVHDSEVQDLQWCGRLAAHLGAREHDNVFAPGSEYWHAYQELLNAHAAMRQISVRTRVQGADEITTTPGYLHVYHVLTAPFDSERMIALTRSQTYHRLVEALLERAKKDPTIVIPRENVEWWERTAMAGLHRPMQEPAPAAAPAVSNRSGSPPIWILWPIVLVLMSSLRMCASTSGLSSSSSSYSNPERMEEISQLAAGKMPEGPPTTTELLLAEDSPLARLGHCDPQTLRELKTFIQRVPRDPAAKPESASRRGYLKWRLVLDESRPEVAALLAKCAPPPAAKP